LAGIYGMNFDHMPELHHRYGYFWLLGVMFSMAVGMVYYFYRRGWLK
jgi:magnesium transporter